ncbi:MAG: nitronate monooxygenase [Candidatus Hodarchaeota archaeon]
MLNRLIWNTRITKLTRTKYPLIMAAFAGYGIAEFAAAYSNAGGLGIITALSYELKDFKNKLNKMQDLTNNPFGVNITVDEDGDKETYLKYLEVAINAGVNIFTTSAYQAIYIGKRIHEAGCYWFPKCPLMRHAISAEKAGADAITLMGMESAGFKNPYQQTTLVNLTTGRSLLKTPLIAAGGIGDARGFLGALAMGADAVCLGTAILTTEESPLSVEIKIDRINTDIFTEDYHRRLYHRTLRGTSVPSPSISFQKKIIPLRDFIENIMNEAEIILKSWGFEKEEFNTLSI